MACCRAPCSDLAPAASGVFGEAAMFSAHVTGPQRLPMGMNALYAAGNPQFVLNTLHWLAGLLTDR